MKEQDMFPPEIINKILECLLFEILKPDGYQLYRSLLFSNKQVSILTRNLFQKPLSIFLSGLCQNHLEFHFWKFKNIFSNSYLALTTERFWNTLPATIFVSEESRSLWSNEMIMSDYHHWNELIATAEKTGIIVWKQTDAKLWRVDENTLYFVEEFALFLDDNEKLWILFKNVQQFTINTDNIECGNSFDYKFKYAIFRKDTVSFNAWDDHHFEHYSFIGLGLDIDNLIEIYS